MELEEEKNREAAAKAHAERESAIAKKKNKQAMVDLLSHSEKKLFADRQRIAGNESFRCGDYKIALVQYTESIELLQTAAAYNNRAATYLKLKQFNEASEDCNRVLALEPDNVKALIRKAEALQGLEEYVKVSCIMIIFFSLSIALPYEALLDVHFSIVVSRLSDQ